MAISDTAQQLILFYGFRGDENLMKLIESNYTEFIDFTVTKNGNYNRMYDIYNPELLIFVKLKYDVRDSQAGAWLIE